jgi:hypothetical protein
MLVLSKMPMHDYAMHMPFIYGRVRVNLNVYLDVDSCSLTYHTRLASSINEITSA